MDQGGARKQMLVTRLLEEIRGVNKHTEGQERRAHKRGVGGERERLAVLKFQHARSESSIAFVI